MDRPARRPGPPVDAARLQPDNQGDIHRVDEGLVGAWLDDPDLAAELADELEQLERLRRLQADEELVLALQEHGFTQREIADKLGLRDAKSVENLLGHQLRQLRNRKRTS